MIQPGIKPGVWTSMQSGKAFPGFLDLNKQIRDVLNSNGYPIWGDCCIKAPLATDIGKVLTIGANGIVLATASSSGVVNLSLGTPTSTTFPVTNSSGTGFILPSANSTQAGLLSATQFNQLTNLVNNGLLSSNSITGNGVIGTPFQLVNDSAVPGNNFYYGTNALGVKGYYAITSGVTNLGYTASPTNGIITNSNGTPSTIPLVDSINAGLQSAADKTKSDFITVTQAVDLDAIESNTNNLVTLSGVAASSTNLGTFTGTTIGDNLTNKAALQSLETAVELKATDSNVVHLAGNETITGIKTFAAQPAGITATSIVNVPAGNIVATTTQAALNELDAEKQLNIQFQDETVNLGTAGTVNTINFAGAGITSARLLNTITVTVPSASESYNKKTLIPTGTNTISNLSPVPNDPTEVMIQVNGLTTNSGITVNAGGIFTINSSVLGYTIDNTDIVECFYFS
jgi:hypothetical protein